MKPYQKYLLTGAIVLIAVLMVLFKYRAYVANPWTRDGQVRAYVVQIDPRTFQASLDQARAQLDQTGGNVVALEKQVDAAKAAVRASQAAEEQAQSAIAQMVATIEKNKAEYERQQTLLPKKATSVKALQRAKANYEVAVQQKKAAEAGFRQAEASLAKSQATLAETEAQLVALGKSNPQLRAALAAVEQAELNLEFTRVLAPVDGYVTNLTLRLGSQAVANQPMLALVDINSFWVHGFFKETRLRNIRGGERAIVTLMTYPDSPLEGRVESVGWGIAQQDGSTGVDLLPNISPTFEWIRLAQRVPVRIQLTNVPKDAKLRVGTTCSVLVMTGTGDGGSVPPAPAALQ